MTWRASLAPLRAAAFRFLFLGRLADHVANAAAPIALAFAVLDLGGSAADLGLVLTARTVPLVVLVLLGGVIADRLPRQLVLVAANVVGALTQALVAVLLLSGHAAIWQLAVIESVNGAASAFLFPAASGLTPQTVPPSQLQPANALLRLAINFAMITGAAGGGILVAAVGSGWAFAADSVLFALGAVLLARIRLPRSGRVDTGSVLADLRDGWTEFRSRTWLWVVVVQSSFLNAAVACAMVTLGPVVADETIGRAAWGLVLAAQTAGMFAGGLVALRSTSSRPLRVGILAVLPVAGLLLVLGLDPRIVPLLVVAFVAGVGLETFTVAWDVAMQSNVPADRLSRVYAYDWFGSLVFIPVGQAAAGPLSALVGVRATIVGAAMVVAVCTLAALSVPNVRNLRRATPAPERTELTPAGSAA